jgi:DNA polymerase III subunit epsilon
MDKEINHEQAIASLESTGNYKILYKYEKPKYYHQDDGLEKLKGLFIDVETTGLNYEIDKIIEIALVPFEFSKDGRIFKLLDGYSCLEDPKMALSQKIISLTGITNEMLHGKSFNDDEIKHIVSSSELIIFHNAIFDRKFLEKRFTFFNEKAWGCSLSQVPWSNEGLSCGKLEYLAYKFGFFFEGHRAEIDCCASLHLLSMNLPRSGNLAMKVLLDNACAKLYRIWALGSPFATKNSLKNRGYRWWLGGNGKDRSWYVDVDEKNKDQELSYLKDEIFKADIELPIDLITAFNRFSERI